MIDYQRIVDDLRAAAASASVETADMLRMAAADYVVACEEVNDRLRACGQLLKRGLRAEALQQADMEPNLLDVAATLDLPERTAMLPLLKSLGIVPPPALLLDVASELNEAYAQQAPLETLLAQHRLQALAGSPLSARITTLRLIARLDSTNPVWQEDLLLYERERLKEIQNEANQAARAGNLFLLESLQAELQAVSWLEIPPSNLVRTL